jgi:glutamate synthase domain-containing protein 2
MPLMDLVGMSIREALPRLVDLRNEMGLKDRIRIVASGKLVNPGDMAWAMAAGADFVTSARGLHVRAGLHPGAEVPQEHLPHRDHHP